MHETRRASPEWLRVGVRVRCASNRDDTRPLLVEVRNINASDGPVYAQVMVPGALSGQSGNEAELAFSESDRGELTWRHLTLTPPEPVGSLDYNRWLADQICVELARATARLRLARHETRLGLVADIQQLADELASVLHRTNPLGVTR